MLAPEILDTATDLLEYLAVYGYVLVREGAKNLADGTVNGVKQVWNLAEPIKKPIGKFSNSVKDNTVKGIGKISNSVKNNTMKGWRVIAPVVKPAASHIKNGTVAGWKFISPKAAKTMNLTVQGWQYVKPKIDSGACAVVNGVRNCSVATYQFVKPKVGPAGRAIKNKTVSGWNLIKPLPGHVANFTV